MFKDTTFHRAGDDLRVGILFTKVDEEKRTVSGFATLDNVDAHGDIVSADASIKAFRKFRGGLREMHTNNAVGSIISFEETKKYDPETDKVYRGVYVTARVSKGAPNTWEKVLDGTLKGFSIGGKIKKKGIQKMEDGSEHPVIEDYDLIELSLVDNPANPLANVLTVQKIGDTFVYSEIEKAAGPLSVGDYVSWNSSGGRANGRITRIVSSGSIDVPNSSVTISATEDDPAALIRVYRDGEPTETLVGHKVSTLTKIDPIAKSQYNILYHSETGDVVLSEEEDREGFVNIGWAEENDVEAIKRAIDQYKASSKEESEESITLVLHKKDVLNAIAQTMTLSKEVLSMATETIEKDATSEVVTEETLDKSVDEAVEAVSEDVAEAVEDAAEEAAVDVEEEVSDEEVEKLEDSEIDLDSIVSKVQDVVVEAVKKAVEAANESRDAVESVKTSFDETLTELNKQISDLKDNLDGLNGRLESVESETAVKKSSDIRNDVDDEDEEDANFWRGSGFLSATDLIKG